MDRVSSVPAVQLVYRPNLLDYRHPMFLNPECSKTVSKAYIQYVVTASDFVSTPCFREEGLKYIDLEAANIVRYLLRKKHRKRTYTAIAMTASTSKMAYQNNRLLTKTMSIKILWVTGLTSGSIQQWNILDVLLCGNWRG